MLVIKPEIARSSGLMQAMMIVGKGKIQPPIEVVSMSHPKVVNSAWFSPVTGQKIMTTCIDNRIRVWDTLFNADQPADREIVHSHVSDLFMTASTSLSQDDTALSPILSPICRSVVHLQLLCARLESLIGNCPQPQRVSMICLLMLTS